MIDSSKAVAIGIATVVLLAGGGYVAATDIGGTNGLQIASPAQSQEDVAGGEPAATAEGSGSTDGADYSSGSEGDDPTETVDDSDETESGTVTAGPTNAAPSADAGGDRTVPEGRVTELDASGSTDPDGEIHSYAWRQADGPNVTIDDRETRTPSFTAPSIDAERTNLTFVLTVRDDDGATATDTVSVTVSRRAEDSDDGDHRPPSAETGSDQTVSEDANVTLDATASSDPDGSIESYAWTQTSGPNVTLSDTASASPTFTAPSVDVVTDLSFEVAVTDHEGGTDTDGVVVTVEPVTREDAFPDHDEAHTRGAIARAKYDANFSDLGTDRARQVEELYLRQPFANETPPGDVRTRDELANERYGNDFDGLNRNRTVDVQRAFDEQFGAAETESEYTRDDISLAKYGYRFSDLSTETAGEMEELYNRQPFADGITPGDVRTRIEIADDQYGEPLDELSRETRLEIENEYHEQFASNDSAS
ncbi:PKD domain-containing protein [Halobellus rarus]|uniref:PKD domain-containing protein n=1 Tax=Halobellus rarus TaxID=1126237 RepID=A0ABD6CNC2_9EURY|nr:PKD domain-containing protein [Halobellus rarus]